jgi:signal transduction histidine kinase
LPVDLRRSPLRLLAGVAVIAAVALEIQSLGHALQGQARQRERLLEKLEGDVHSVPEQVALRLQAEGSPWPDAADHALRSTFALEAELFDAQGRCLAARPARAPVTHWPRAGEIASLRGPRRLLVGPLGDAEPRMLLYAAVPGQEHTVLLRLAFPAWELLDDIQSRRQYLVGHAVTLLVLLLAGVMAVLPARALVAPAPPRVLEAYDAALARLRDQGRAEVQRHRSERQRMEEEKHDRDAMVRAGELTAGMVHEVRNGLNTILGYARLAERGSDAAEASAAAAHIREECEHLVTLVRRFMGFIQRETLNLGTFSLPRLLARVAAREAGEPASARVVLRDGADVTLEGDEDLLERAFENLVRNARQAAGARGYVWIEWRVEGGRAAIVVSDDGPGMPAEVRATLRPFFTTKAGGLGLGLATAMKIVRLHGGELVLGDRPPHGLAATVRLPLAGTTRPLPSVTTEPARAGSADHS